MQIRYHVILFSLFFSETYKLVKVVFYKSVLENSRLNYILVIYYGWLIKRLFFSVISKSFFRLTIVYFMNIIY